MSLRSYDLISRNVSSAKTTGESSQPFVRKAQYRAGHLVDIFKSPLAIVRTEGADFEWLRLKYVTRRVYAVDSDIVERSPSQILLKADVSLFDLHREHRVEDSKVAQLSRLSQLDCFQVRFLKVKAIGDHQLHIVLTSRADHVFTFRFGNRHRLLAKHVNAGPACGDGIVAMHAVRQRDI